jgi:hypothetical protein
MHARMSIFGGYTPEQASGQSATIVDTISKGVEQLISQGAMYVVVLGMLPVGCFPIYLTRQSSPLDGMLWREGKNRGKKST